MLEYIIIGFLGVLLVLIFLIYQKINSGDSLGVGTMGLVPVVRSTSTSVG